MIFNTDLASHYPEWDRSFKDLGFEYVSDGTDDHRGHYWQLKNDGFEITIDAWYIVFLERKDEEGQWTDQIKVLVTDPSELQNLIDWIQPAEKEEGQLMPNGNTII